MESAGLHKANNSDERDWFGGLSGNSVSLNTDGTTVAVGAPVEESNPGVLEVTRLIILLIVLSLLTPTGNFHLELALTPRPSVQRCGRC